MKPSDILQVLLSSIASGVPAFISGAPGLGKSQLVSQAAAQLGRALVDIRAPIRQPVDFLGLPVVKDGLTHWAAPAELPNDTGPGVLFLDELPNAAPMVQSALLQLVLDRKIGSYTLPDGWALVAAGNRVQDRAGAGRLIASLADRFIQVEMEADTDDWVRWAFGAGLDPRVVAFIRFRPSMLCDIDPARAVNASPRSWEKVATVLPHVADGVRPGVVAGLVGDGPAAEFEGFLRVFQSLPDVDGILLNADAAPVPDDPAVLYALCGALARKASGDTAERIIKYARRLPPEFGVLLVRDAQTVDHAGVCNTVAFQQWASDNAAVYA